MKVIANLLRGRAFLLLAALILTNTGWAQTTNSMLWKVSGKGLKQPSYILGTMHLMCGEDFEIKPKVKQALSEVKTVTFEADINDMEGSEKLMALMKPIPDPLHGLSKTQTATLDSLFKENQLTTDILKQVSPFGLMSMLTVKAINCGDVNNIKMMEKELADLADDDSLKLDYLEPVDFQIDMIQSMNTTAELLTTLKGLKESPHNLKELVAVYKSENLEQLNKMMNDPKFMSALQQTKLLKERNKNWATLLPEKMQQASSLIAVGAGHLGGADGLLSLLKNAGYTVTPVN